MEATERSPNASPPETAVAEPVPARLLALWRQHTASGTRVFLWAFAIASLWFVASIGYFRFYDDPPEPHDGPDYDMIGLSLANGHGFGMCWSDPDYHRPYVESDRLRHATDYAYLETRTGEFVPTTYRPPFLPFVLSAIYRTCGRQFWVWRVCASVFVGAAVAMAALLAYRFAGPVPAALTVAWGVVDPRLLNFAAAYMTEAPSTFGVLVLSLLLVRLWTGRTGRGTLVSIGVALGLLTLVRSVFIVWYAPVLLLVWWATARGGARRPGGPAPRTAVLLTLVVALLVPSPWWVRNCRVLGRFMPLGSQGYIALPGGYSWYAVMNRGQWTLDAENEIKAGLLRDRPDLAAKPLELEREFALACRDVAVAWVTTNPHRIPQLVWYKLRRLWTPQSTYETLLFLCALCGALLLAMRPWVWPLLALVATETLTCAGTFCDGGRYLVPLHPLLHLLAAVGVMAFCHWGWDQVQAMRRNAPAFLTPRDNGPAA